MRSVYSLLMLVVLVGVASVAPQATLRAQPSRDLSDTFTVTPESGTVGTTFTFTYAGEWLPGEKLDYWVTGPGSLAPFELGEFRNDPEIRDPGTGVTTWIWTAPEGIWSGLWTMNARGRTSYDAVQIPFVLTVGEEPFPQGAVSPVRGPPGTRFNFSFDGWPKGDVIDSWVLAPGQRDPYDVDRFYGESDVTRWHWIAPEEAWGGVWIMGARGKYSELSIQIAFVVEGPPAPPPPSGAVSNRTAVPGEMLTFTADQYASYEPMNFWVTPPGQVAPIYSSPDDELYADLDGTVSWQWIVPPDAELGLWSMTILGRRTQREQQIVFEVVQPGTAQPTQSVVPASGSPGTTFRFTALGFGVEEPIGYWITRPDGTSFSDNRALRSDGQGNVVLDWISQPGDIGGVWAMSMRGNNSLKQVIFEFALVRDVPPPADPALQGVEPAVGIPGTTFRFYAEGFRQHEVVGWWATSPTGEIFEGGVDVEATKNGRIDWVWTAPTYAQPGRWTMSIDGKQSETERMIAFEVVPADTATAPPPPPYEVIPSAGPPGTLFTFAIAGLVPNERISYWLTAPDGTIVVPGAEDDPSTAPNEIKADPDGNLSLMWEAPLTTPRGRWTMVLQSSFSDDIKANTQLEIPFLVQ